MKKLIKLLTHIQNYFNLVFRKIKIFLLKIKLNYVKFKIIICNVKYYILKKLLDFAMYIIIYVKLHRYIWVGLFTILCIFINIFFKNWPYKDYIWISVIISLLIISAIDTEDIQEDEN